MENTERLERGLFLRLSPELATKLEKKAKREALGERPNLSATARRAIRHYLVNQEGEDEKETD